MMPTLWRFFSNDAFEPFGRRDWMDQQLAEMNRLSRTMDRVSGRSGRGDLDQLPAISYPAVDLWQDNDRFFVEAELPGVEIDNLDISVMAGNQLSISGERKPPMVEGGTWHRQERGFGKFSRRLTLPCQVKSDEVDAQLKEGILTIQLPKSEAAKPRRLAIKAT